MVLGLIFSLIPSFGNLTRLASFMVGMAFPTLESLKAIESKQLGDDTQWLIYWWLMYWVCYATMISLELLMWPVLSWIPGYRLYRVLALAWLALPQFRGATLLYQEFVRPFLLVGVEKGRQLPALEPYLRGFGGVATKPATSQAATAAGETQPPASPATAMPNFEALKREAVAKVEETFEKAKQQAVSTNKEEEEEEPLPFQPLKAHAQ